jgi:Mrp family chromosome partitioning ATPase
MARAARRRLESCEMGISLDQALQAAVDPDRVAIPGFVRPTGETLGRPDLQQPFLDRCRRSLQALISGPEVGGVLQVCSPRNDEWRASVSAAMAISLVRTYGERVALLDLDFATGGLTRVFSVNPVPGMADWLEGGERLRVVAGGPNRLLHLLPVGQHYRDPALLHSEIARRQVIETLMRHFTWVVMDLPPLLTEPSAAHLLPFADYRVLVGRYRQTVLRDLEETAEQFGTQGQTGFLLTGDTSRVPRWIRRLI